MQRGVRFVQWIVPTVLLWAGGWPAWRELQQWLHAPAYSVPKTPYVFTDPVFLPGCPAIPFDMPAGTYEDEEAKWVRALSVEQVIEALSDDSRLMPFGHYQSVMESAQSRPLELGGVTTGVSLLPARGAMSELIRRGVDALPALLEHIDDARPTHGVITPLSGRPMRHANEYFSRYVGSEGRPAGTVHPGDRELHSASGEVSPQGPNLERYALRVGDLCLVALGSIVNRAQYVARYSIDETQRPIEPCVILNSPVETPSIAAAVRNEWSGLTADEHRASLLEDAWSTDSVRARYAIERLTFYYADSGEAAALELLRRPLYPREVVRRFLVAELLPTREPKRTQASDRGFSGSAWPGHRLRAPAGAVPTSRGRRPRRSGLPRPP